MPALPCTCFFWKQANLQAQSALLTLLLTLLPALLPVHTFFWGGFFFLILQAERHHMPRRRESWGEKCNEACTRCRGHVMRWNGIIRFLLLNQLGHAFRSALKRSLFTRTPERDFPLLTCMCAPWAHAARPLFPCCLKIKTQISSFGCPACRVNGERYVSHDQSAPLYSLHVINWVQRLEAG